MNDLEIAQRLGPLLKKARESRKFTQLYVAQESHTAVTDLSRYENGRTMPGVSRIAAICRVLGLRKLDLGEVVLTVSIDSQKLVKKR